MLEADANYKHTVRKKSSFALTFHYLKEGTVSAVGYRMGEVPMSNRLIDLQHITKIYDDNTVLDDLNLYIRENEFLTLLGPAAAEKQQLCALSAVLKAG